MLSLFKIENIKTYLLVGVIVACVIFWKDYQYQIKENTRQTENNRQIRLSDSLKYAEVTLNKKEIIEELNYNNKSLLNKLEESNIKLNRIQKIVTQKQTYIDTAKSEIKITGLVKAIAEGIPVSFPVLDSTQCWLMKGIIIFDGKEVELKITDRQFKNVTDLVTFWERREWSFLGIKTRLFGKRQVTVKVYNTCGETETYVIQNKKQLRQ